MNKEIFAALSFQKRCDMVAEEGQFLDSVKYYRYKAHLYSLHSFFIEILCYQGSTDIEKIEVADEDKLVKYLNRIDVSALHGFISNENH